jgi:hypothetical protein
VAVYDCLKFEVGLTENSKGGIMSILGGLIGSVGSLVTDTLGGIFAILGGFI